MDRKALSAAFPVTVPVLMGYLAIGIAFGLMLQEIGYNFIWAFFMSLTIYAGSGQYLGVTLLGAAASLGTVAVMTLLINFRHLVYGLSMLEKFRGMGPRKLYMIFSLTDETYALLSSARAPVGVDPRNFYFAIALLDQSYWILGSVIGAVAGALIPFSTEGVDFAMTALFVVIALDQWRSYRKHLPAVLGDGAVSDCPGPLLRPGSDAAHLAGRDCAVPAGPAGQAGREGGRDMLSTAGAVAAIAVMAIITFLTRALPFLLFDRGESPPKLVLYLGRVLPPAIIAMLIVYCLRGVSFAAPGGWVPQLVSVAAVVILHLWRSNTLLSIFEGTILYMVLVQAVFP